MYFEIWLVGVAIVGYVLFQFLVGEWLHQHPEHPEGKAIPVGTQLAMLIPWIILAAIWPVTVAFWASNVNRKLRKLRDADASKTNSESATLGDTLAPDGTKV